MRATVIVVSLAVVGGGGFVADFGYNIFGRCIFIGF